MTLIFGLQSHAQRIESGPVPRTAEARKQDIQQVHGQSIESKLHAVALTQGLRQQDSPWRSHSHGNTNAKQNKDAELSGPHVAHRQSAAAPQETESLWLFLSWRSCSLQGLKNSKMALIVVVNSKPRWACFSMSNVQGTRVFLWIHLWNSALSFCTNKLIVNYANNRSLSTLFNVIAFASKIAQNAMIFNFCLKSWTTFLYNGPCVPNTPASFWNYLKM